MKIKNYTFALTFLLCSCVNQIDSMSKNTQTGQANHFYMLTGIGGTHAAESSAGTRYTGNLENSFQVFAQSLLSYGLSLNQTKQLVEGEITDRYKAGQFTIQEANKLKAEVAMAASKDELTATLAKLSH